MASIARPLDTDERFRTFLEVAPDAVVVIDSLGRIVVVNELTERMFGYSRAELVDQSIEILLPERYRHAHIEHRMNFFLDPKTRPMGEGRTLTGLRKDGREFPVEISLSPLRTGKETFVTSIIRDVSARMQLEAKFRGLLESAPDAIVVVDTRGKITIVNTQTEKLFGYAREELVGQPIEILVPTHARERHIEYRGGYIEKPRTRPMGAGRALMGRRKDGTEVPVEISLSPLETEQGTLITSIIRDITERRKTEEQKEALLKEIHHRVKNNLQVTSSLLRLQSSQVQDENVRELFAESQNRIRSMALVHEKLYQSLDLSRINFADYIESLAELLFRSFGVSKETIACHIDAHDVFLSVETAVPCGLMINELLSNCLKHAFPHGRKGEIRVSMRHESANQLSLDISDNGVGLPAGFDVAATESLGLQLVRTLTRQLDGTLSVVSDGGTTFRIAFGEMEAP